MGKITDNKNILVCDLVRDKGNAGKGGAAVELITKEYRVNLRLVNSWAECVPKRYCNGSGIYLTKKPMKLTAIHPQGVIIGVPVKVFDDFMERALNE